MWNYENGMISLYKVQGINTAAAHQDLLFDGQWFQCFIKFNALKYVHVCILMSMNWPSTYIIGHSNCVLNHVWEEKGTVYLLPLVKS